MLTDAYGGLWIDNPLLAFGLLSLVWVLLAYLHPFASRDHAPRAAALRVNTRTRPSTLYEPAAKRRSVERRSSELQGAWTADPHIGVLPCQVQLLEPFLEGPRWGMAPTRSGSVRTSGQGRAQLRGNPRQLVVRDMQHECARTHRVSF